MNLSHICQIISFTFPLTLLVCSELHLKKYNILNNLKISQNYRTLNSVDSVINCAARCLYDGICTAANYNKAENKCEFTNHSPDDGTVGIKEDQNWKIIYFKNQLWNLIFRATSGIGIPTYSAYMGTAPLPMPSDACKLPQTTNCTTHYRDPGVIESWNSHNIQLHKLWVQFVLYKAGVAVVNITFSNSVSDDNTSWFSSDHIISSSYVDLDSTTICNYFGIYGVPRVQRRFYISHGWYQCPGDAGWVCVFDVDLTGTSTSTCPYEEGLSYPYFAYVPNSKGIFATGLQGADVLAIYTKN